MSEDTIVGKLKSVGGKIKQSTGEAVGSQSLANSGAADQVEGAVQETWGKTKDATHDVTAGHDARTGVTGAAERAKDSITRGIDTLKNDLHHDNPEVSQVH